MDHLALRSAIPRGMIPAVRRALHVAPTERRRYRLIRADEEVAVARKLAGAVRNPRWDTDLLVSRTATQVTRLAWSAAICQEERGVLVIVSPCSASARKPPAGKHRIHSYG